MQISNNKKKTACIFVYYNTIKWELQQTRVDRESKCKRVQRQTIHSQKYTTRLKTPHTLKIIQQKYKLRRIVKFFIDVSSFQKCTKIKRWKLKLNIKNGIHNDENIFRNFRLGTIFISYWWKWARFASFVYDRLLFCTQRFCLYLGKCRNRCFH